MSTINTVYAAEIDKVEYIVAHRDLHFANIMAAPNDDGTTYKITAVLDWEFAGVVPVTRWNPSKAFLWNGQRSPESKEEQSRLWSAFEIECRRRDAGDMLASFRPKKVQDAMQTVVNYIRAIVEVCPKGAPEDLKRAREWARIAETAMIAID